MRKGSGTGVDRGADRFQSGKGNKSGGNGKGSGKKGKDTMELLGDFSYRVQGHRGVKGEGPLTHTLESPVQVGNAFRQGIRVHREGG